MRRSYVSSIINIQENKNKFIDLGFSDQDYFLLMHIINTLMSPYCAISFKRKS